MRLLNTILAATAAASCMVITIDIADAQSRNGDNRSSGGNSSIGSGSSSAVRQSGGASARQSVAPSRSATSRAGSRTGQQQLTQRQSQATTRQGGVNPQQGNRRPGVGNQQANTGQPANRGPVAGNQPANRGPAAGNQPANNAQAGNRGPAAGNQPGNSVRPISPELKSGLGLGGGSFGRNNGLPVHRAVAAHGHQSGRSGLPLTLTPKHTLHKAVHANLHHSYRPFVQRHWKRAFFWIAVAGIGYVTVPEFGYDKFLTYVDRDEPDYQGAVRWLNECSVIEEGHEVPRVTPPAKVVPQATVAVAPDAKYDDRFDRFVNRRWSTTYVWIMVPRVGNVTVPQTIAPQIEQMLGGNPPNFDAALAMMEEAAAADTVVAEAPQVESPTAQQ